MWFRKIILTTLRALGDFQYPLLILLWIHVSIFAYFFPIHFCAFSNLIYYFPVSDRFGAWVKEYSLSPHEWNMSLLLSFCLMLLDMTQNSSHLRPAIRYWNNAHIEKGISISVKTLSFRREQNGHKDDFKNKNY